jgi:hypothetical protein
MNFVWAPDGMSVEQLDRHYMDVISSFYRQKRVRRQYVWLSLRHPEHLARLIRCGAGFALAKCRSLLTGRRGLLISGSEPQLDSQPQEQASYRFVEVSVRSNNTAFARPTTTSTTT